MTGYDEKLFLVFFIEMRESRADINWSEMKEVCKAEMMAE